MGHLLALESAGWHVVDMRTEGSCEDLPIWRVEIRRFDLDASISVCEAELDGALAELVRYASADARERH